MKVLIGIEVGGTSMRAVARLPDGREVSTRSIKTDPENYAVSLRRLVRLANTVSQKHEISKVGIGVSGSIRDGTIFSTSSLKGWIGKPLKYDLENALDAPVNLVSDAQAAACGEATARDGSFVFLLWGAGVGVAVCHRFGDQTAIMPTELGHITVANRFAAAGVNYKCGCGGFNHLEACVGGGYIHKRMGIDPKDLSREKWSTLLLELAEGIYNISAGNPGLPFVIGGSVGINKLLRDLRIYELEHYVRHMKGSIEPPKLHVANNRKYAVLYGALEAAKSAKW